MRVRVGVKTPNPNPNPNPNAKPNHRRTEPHEGQTADARPREVDAARTLGVVLVLELARLRLHLLLEHGLLPQAREVDLARDHLLLLHLLRDRARVRARAWVRARVRVRVRARARVRVQVWARVWVRVRRRHRELQLLAHAVQRLGVLRLLRIVRRLQPRVVATQRHVVGDLVRVRVRVRVGVRVRVRSHLLRDLVEERAVDATRAQPRLDRLCGRG